MVKSSNEINKTGVSNSKTKKKYNTLDSYDLGTREWENSIMFPLKVMKICLIVYIIIALLLPIYKGDGMFIDSFSTILVIILLICGLANCYGRFIDISPMLLIGLVRGVHFLLNIFVFKNQINYIGLIILFILELGLSTFYLFDNSRYECVRVRE